MNSITLFFILILISVLSFFMGRKRALLSVNGHIKNLHSLPNHYGWYAAMSGLLPGLFIIFIWINAGDTIINNFTLASLGDNIRNLSDFDRTIYMNDIRNLVVGDAISRPLTEKMQDAANYYTQMKENIFLLFAVIAIGLSSFVSFLSLRKISPEFRSRNRLEHLILLSLIASSAIAVFTTTGIISSLIFETLQFLDHVSLSEFLFGLKWSPQTAHSAQTKSEVQVPLVLSPYLQEHY